MANATERLWATADGRVVRDGDPDATVLIAAAGDPIPKGYDAPDEGTDDKAVDEPPNKAVKGAPNKSKG